jgi:hypothetical protein
VVAVVVKYADNILKGFAASFSLITSLLLCYFLLDDFDPSLSFFTGAVSPPPPPSLTLPPLQFLVNLSMYLYSYTPPPAPPSSTPPLSPPSISSAHSERDINP